MKCPKCQHDNRSEAKFCDQCAFPLQVRGKKPLIECSRPHSYTPKFLADKILTTRIAMEGERKRVTVLFADVANYTAMAEKLDPEQVHQVMDGCFKILMDEIHRFEGTINQFTGDGVMALFGAPLALENHAQSACRAALSIQTGLKKYSEELKNKNGFEFKMRIGLNSGPVIVGAIGDDLRMDYTAIGDTTNLAARMESLAKPGSILISPHTYKRVEKQFEFNDLGKFDIKGKENALEAYELIKEKIDRPRLGLERQILSEMVGRDKELNKLELQINKAINGEGSVVNIIGEAGIGKSRLIAELKNREVLKRLSFFEGRAVSVGRNLSFHPIISLLKDWARIREEDDAAAVFYKLENAIRAICHEDANEILPFIATLMGMKLAGRHAERVKGIEGEALEKLIFKNVRELLIRSSEKTPLVILVEDLHWADASSIELLESLFKLSEIRRIVFINVFRPNHPETGDRIVASLNEMPSVYCVTIRLEPLTAQLSEMLINNMLNIKGLSHTIIDQIIERSGGNPFFIEEVVRSFIDEGAVVKSSGEFRATEKIERMVIPHTIHDVLMARIDRLDEDTRELLKTASVIGRSFFYRILTEVAQTIEDLDSRLAYLKDVELIRERRRMEELEFLFKHALAQEAAYESILHQKRKDLHLQVAQSIERVFTNRLHEFYGMLSLHYIKGENYEKAEEYLIKAGEEALRTSASSEALNYYQEGLKLYLQTNKANADPEKLAMFEKNIAIALYNKCRWKEAVEHIDKVLEHWSIPSNPNKAIVLIKAIKNIIVIMTLLDRLYKKAKPSSIQRDIDTLKLFFIRNCAYVYFDNIRFFFHTLSAFNMAIRIDMTKSPDAINILINMGGMFSYTGLSYNLSQRFLNKCESEMDNRNIGNLMSYIHIRELMNLHSGNWENDMSYQEAIVNNAISKGDFFNSLTYILWFFMAQIEIGGFVETEQAITKLMKLGANYDYKIAYIYAYWLNAGLLLKKGLLSEAVVEADKGLVFSTKHIMEMNQLVFLGLKAEIFAMLKNTDKSKDLLHRAQAIIKRNKFIVPAGIAPYLVAHFANDIILFKKAMVTNDGSGVSSLQKNAFKSGKEALKGLRKYAPYRTKLLCLTGEYYWIVGKQKKAIKWWSKSIKTGEEICARPDLSRAYFTIGKYLMDPNSQYKTLNGIAAKEYLDKARVMFQEMELQWDLDELDKVMASN